MATRVLAGFVAILVVVVAVSSVVLVSFNDLKRNFGRLTAEQLPRALAAKELDRHAGLLAAQVPALVLAQGGGNRDSALQRTLDEVRLLDTHLNILAGAGIAPARLDEVRRASAEMVASLKQIDSLATERVRVESRLRDARLALLTVDDELRRTLARTPADLPSALLELVELLKSGMAQAHPEPLQDIARQFSDRVAAAEELARLAAGTPLAGMFRPIMMMGKGDGGVFTLRQRLFDIDTQMQANVRAGRQQGDVLRTSATSLAADIDQEAGSLLGRVEENIDMAARVLMTAALAVVIVTGLTYVYLRRRVLLRLDAIGQHMNAGTLDDPARVVVSGDDEIADMGRALRFFLETIASREAEIRTSRTLAEQQTLELSLVSEQLNLALEASRDGIWDWDLTTGRIWFSPRWKEQFGYADDELENSLEMWKGLIFPEDLEDALRRVDDYNSGRIPRFEAVQRFRHKDGHTVHIHSRAIHLKDAEGRVVRMVGAHTDITREVELRAEADRLRRRLDFLVNASPSVIYACKPGDPLEVTFCSDGLRQFGCAPDDLVSDPGWWRDHLHPDDAKEALEALATLWSEGSVEHSYRLRHGDGSWRWVMDKLRLIRGDDGQPVELIGSLTDITPLFAAQQAAREANARFSAILANSPVGIALVGPGRIIRQVNQAFPLMFGRAEHEMVGQNTRILYACEDDYHRMLDRAVPLMRLGEVFQTELPMRRADGTEFWCNMRGQMVDPDMPEMGQVWVIDDVSERRLAELARLERQELFEQMFVSGLAVKMLIDPASGSIVDANPAAADFYGYSLAELRSMSISQINTLPPDHLRAEMDRAAQEERGHFLFRHRLASGEVRDVEVYAGRVTVRGRTLILSLIHDVTDRRRFEEELARQAAELRRANGDLARSNAELEAFAYVASHDLRQPLRMISSYLSLLERRLTGQLDEDGREFMDFARSGAQRMDRLIVDLLEYSRVGRRGKPFAPVALDEVVGVACHNLEVAMEEGGATVTVEPGLPTILGDDGELIRLFQNLVGNAIKYRAPDRAPVIQVSWRDEGAAWRLAVSDNGIGIAPEHHERVFGIFQRLHRAEEYDGTGIGLAVCRKVVEHHGGRIWVESPPEGGSAFLFTLPKMA